MALAKAHKFRKDALAKETPRPPEYNISINRGKNLVRYLARIRSPYQEEARLLAAAFNVSVAAAPTEPTNFEEAMQVGREAMELMKSAPQMAAELKDQIKAAKDPADKKKLEEQLQTVENSATNAMNYFRMALDFADEQTPIEDVNVAQYYVAYFYFAFGDMYSSAVMAEFVARRYSDSAGARECAKIAMTCYLHLFRANKTGDRSFEKQQAMGICEYMLDRWPEEPEAVDAANTLIAFMLQDDNADKAVGYLARIPAASPHRGKAELQTGQALWSKYLRGLEAARALPKGAERDQAVAAIEGFKTQAAATLSDGVERMRQSGGADELMGTAVLSLAQIYVDSNQPAKAIELCEDPAVGVLALVRKKHAATEREGFTVEAYRTALRAYVSSLSASDDPDAAIEKARGIMGELKQVMASDPEGEKSWLIFMSVLPSGWKNRSKTPTTNRRPPSRRDSTRS